MAQAGTAFKKPRGAGRTTSVASSSSAAWVSACGAARGAGGGTVAGFGGGVRPAGFGLLGGFVAPAGRAGLRIGSGSILLAIRSSRCLADRCPNPTPKYSRETLSLPATGLGQLPQTAHIPRPQLFASRMLVYSLTSSIHVSRETASRPPTNERAASGLYRWYFHPTRCRVPAVFHGPSSDVVREVSRRLRALQHPTSPSTRV